MLSGELGGVLMKPFFTYFGGKYRAAPKYPNPQYETIIEPFAGSAGYSLRYPERKIELYDLDETVIGTWQYLISVSEDEIRSLPVYDGTWQSVEDLSIAPEAKWLIGWWLNKGTTRPSKTPSKWVRDANGNNGENYWGEGIRERIASQLSGIRHWKAVHSSYVDIPNSEATWYIDPPYEVAGKYRIRDVDFKELGSWCQERQGQVMVCENLGATWLPFEPFADVKATHGKVRSGVSKEVLWYRDEVCTRMVVREYLPLPKGMYLWSGPRSRLVLKHENCPIHRVEQWGSLYRTRDEDGTHDEQPSE